MTAGHLRTFSGTMEMVYRGHDGGSDAAGSSFSVDRTTVASAAARRKDSGGCAGSRSGRSNVGGSGATGLLEKDITLQLATEAGRLIEELLGARVILTRTDDTDVPLDARAALANQAGGDLFISLHAGGSLANDTTGISDLLLR